MKYDQSLLLKYIYRETCPQRINQFETFLWRGKDDCCYTAADVEKVINYYFSSNNDETIDIIENFVIRDFINL